MHKCKSHTGSNPVLTTNQFTKMANITKPKRKVATTLLNVDLPNRLQNLQVRRNKIKADAEPIVSIADLHNEAIEMLLRKEQL